MDISPQQIRTAEFSAARKGLDPDEVREFLERVASELERAQNQSTAMEARARAAVARLQELSEGAAAQAPVADPTPATESAHAPEPAATADPTPTRDDADTISRTLLLAQRTADSVVAEAEAEAARIRAEADTEAAGAMESAREITARLVDEARDEARRAGAAERQAVEGEVDSLKARREFLSSDVEHLEAFLADERSRLREAATSLLELTERVPGGMGEVRLPLLSASDDDTPGGIDGIDFSDAPDTTFDDVSDTVFDTGVDAVPEADTQPDNELHTEPTESASESAGATSDASTGELFLQTDIADDREH
ncbi:MAG: DivIVA domain-containing protein [Actinomycetota bacterium]